MKNDTRWILAALFAGVAAGAAIASRSRHLHHHRGLQHRQHKADLHTWEGEGGNLAPTPPGMRPL